MQHGANRKARGWKRRMRELDRWGAAERVVPPGALDDGDYHSAELWFTRWPFPWPLGVQRRMVAQLVAIHDAWLPQLRALGSHAEPLYLGVWLLEPGLMESQVVAAGGEAGRRYAARHRAHPLAPTPPPRYDGRPCDLARFEWRRAQWVDRQPLSEHDPADWAALRRRADVVEPSTTGDPGDAIVGFARETWYGWLPEIAAAFDGMAALPDE